MVNAHHNTLHWIGGFKMNKVTPSSDLQSNIHCIILHLIYNKKKTNEI